MATDAHGAAEGGLVFHPMDQFIVKPLFGHGEVGIFTLTNVTLWMALTVLAIFALLVLGTSGRATIPNRIQSIAELAYDFIRKMVEDVAGKDGLVFFPYVMTLFVFILFANFLGLLPMAFTTTSHIAVTLGLAAIVFGIVCIVGFALHGFKFFKLFWPAGSGPVLGAFVFVIEFLSFLSRPFTLAIRLFANMTAGHVLLKVFGTFVVTLGSFQALPYVFGVLPLAVNVALAALEVLIAVVQAYVFALLASLYLNDAINLH